MSAGNIGIGQVGIFSVVGVDTNGAERPVTGTAKVDNYTTAYLASTGNAGEYMLVPKIDLAPGQKVTVTSTFSAKAADGTVIADFQVAFDLEGAVVPAATKLALKSSVVTPKAGLVIPPDPGSDTIPIK